MMPINLPSTGGANKTITINVGAGCFESIDIVCYTVTRRFLSAVAILAIKHPYNIL